jgi:predicted methyltransferase
MIVVSAYTLHPALEAHRAGLHNLAITPDLGITHCEVDLEPAGVHFPAGETLAWESVETVCASEGGCFVVENGMAEKIQAFSADTDRVYSLYPTQGAPTMLLSGLPMHRIKGVDPHQDTLNKVKTIRPLVGRVLDTATGLGYTAIEAARSAEQVTTIELDPAVLTIARRNPWSGELFDNPKITQVIGDSFDQAPQFANNTFSRIIHDPPMFSLAGDLYSGEFYRQLWRILKNTGRLFHYIGDLESSSGQRVTRGVVRRLQEAGFKNITHRKDAFGLVAYK